MGRRAHLTCAGRARILMRVLPAVQHRASNHEIDARCAHYDAHRRTGGPRGLRGAGQCAAKRAGASVATRLVDTAEAARHVRCRQLRRDRIRRIAGRRDGRSPTYFSPRLRTRGARRLGRLVSLRAARAAHTFAHRMAGRFCFAHDLSSAKSSRHLGAQEHRLACLIWFVFATGHAATNNSNYGPVELG